MGKLSNKVRAGIERRITPAKVKRFIGPDFNQRLFDWQINSMDRRDMPYSDSKEWLTVDNAKVGDRVVVRDLLANVWKPATVDRVFSNSLIAECDNGEFDFMRVQDGVQSRARHLPFMEDPLDSSERLAAYQRACAHQRNRDETQQLLEEWRKEPEAAAAIAQRLMADVHRLYTLENTPTYFITGGDEPLDEFGDYSKEIAQAELELVAYLAEHSELCADPRFSCYSEEVDRLHEEKQQEFHDAGNLHSSGTCPEADCIGAAYERQAEEEELANPDLEPYLVAWPLTDGRIFRMPVLAVSREDAAEQFFNMTNINNANLVTGPDEERWAEMKHRSMSVGDQIVVDGTPMYCDDIGWRLADEHDTVSHEQMLAEAAFPDGNVHTFGPNDLHRGYGI